MLKYQNKLCVNKHKMYVITIVIVVLGIQWKVKKGVMGMTREEMWKEFENQLIRETRTPITVSYDVSERMTKTAIKETVAKWKERLEQEPHTIIIPEGSTNKDVFEAIFGYDPATDAVVCNKEDWCGASKPCNYCISNPNNIGRAEEWWNAPYNAESGGNE